MIVVGLIRLWKKSYVTLKFCSSHYHFESFGLYNLISPIQTLQMHFNFHKCHAEQFGISRLNSHPQIKKLWSKTRFCTVWQMGWPIVWHKNLKKKILWKIGFWKVLRLFFSRLVYVWAYQKLPLFKNKPSHLGKISEYRFKFVKSDSVTFNVFFRR